MDSGISADEKAYFLQGLARHERQKLVAYAQKWTEPKQISKEIQQQMGFFQNLLLSSLQAERWQAERVALLLKLGVTPIRLGFSHSWKALIDDAYGWAQRQEEGKDLAQLAYLQAYLDVQSGNITRGLEKAKEALEIATLAQAWDEMLTAFFYWFDLSLTIFKGVDLAAFEAQLERILAQSQAHYADFTAEMQIKIYTRQIQLYRRQGRVAEIQRILESPIKGFADLDWHHQAIWNHGKGVIFCWTIANYGEACHALHSAVIAYQHMGDVSGEAGALCDLGLVFLAQSRLLEAHQSILLALQKSKMADNKNQIAIITGNLALTYFAQGQLNETLDLVDLHLKLAEQLHLPREIRRARDSRGGILYHFGRYAESIDDLDFAVNFYIGTQNEGYVNSLMLLARSEIQVGEYTSAQAHLTEAFEIAQEKNFTAYLINIHRIQARLFADSAAKQVALQNALELARKMSRQLDEAACLFDLAQLETSAAPDYYEQACAILNKIGALTWLEMSTYPDLPIIL